MKTKSKMKIVWKILAGVAALLIIGFILMIYNAFNGNFISGMVYKSRVTKYIAETYPDKNYTVSDYSYNFKTGRYDFEIIDLDSPDGCFNAYYSDYDKAVVDTYENDVLNLFNTQSRLEKALRDEIDPLIDKHLDTKEKTVNGKYIGGEFGFVTCFIDGFDGDYLKGKLYLDMKADVKNMPIPTQAVLCLNTDESQSFPRVVKLANELKALGYRIDYYDVSTSGKPYEMIPTDRLLAAESFNELEEFVMKDYDKIKED